MSSKTTFKITRIWNMLCRQGSSERYAPLGLSFPPLSRRAPPIHEAMGGYAAPTAPPASHVWMANISVPNHANMTLT